MYIDTFLKLRNIWLNIIHELMFISNKLSELNIFEVL